MDKATHSNMESTGGGDMVENFRQNMKFKFNTDIHSKR